MEWLVSRPRIGRPLYDFRMFDWFPDGLTSAIGAHLPLCGSGIAQLPYLGRHPMSRPDIAYPAMNGLLRPG
ncbi:MAG: hypothetical protein JWQ98_1792 [Chlorobi bacterium]|nr:hypothetical protein [Chlorobiota bacterium]